MDVTLVPCAVGDRWFPWNYGRRSRTGRVGVCTVTAEPGLCVVNAVAPGGQVVGSCALRVGARHSEHILGDEEYRYGAAGAGPAYFWRDDQRSPWILVLKSLWVRPGHRRAGIARRFAALVRDMGLPTYLAFANRHMEAWFDREFRPQPGGRSALQATIATALRAPSPPVPSDRDPDFAVYVQAEASPWLLWRSFHGGSWEPVGLADVLCAPERMDVWSADGGGDFETGFSDSGFADDRTYGYALATWCDGWGPAEDPWQHLPDEPSDDELAAAEQRYARTPAVMAGTIEAWITDPEAMCAYATVRHFLRTLQVRRFDDVGTAARELFVRDLRDAPRGLRAFSAVVTPVRAPAGLAR